MGNNKLKFSVSMCVYGKDNPTYFKRSIESIFNQTLLPDEIVLTVDGPVPQEIDDVIDWAEKTFKSFIVVRLERNMGHGEARRQGLSNCTNDYVAIMDADDNAVNTRFENQIRFLIQHPEVDVLGGQINEFVDDIDNVVGKRIVPLSHKDICEYMKKRCPFNQVTVIFKKSKVEEVGGYIDWYCDEDYYLWIRMYLAGCTFANIDENLVNVRVGKDMYARRGGRKYYKSEKNLFKYMYKHKVISWAAYQKAKFIRFVVQVLMTNRTRQWFFKKFARN